MTRIEHKQQKQVNIKLNTLESEVKTQVSNDANGTNGNTRLFLYIMTLEEFTGDPGVYYYNDTIIIIITIITASSIA